MTGIWRRMKPCITTWPESVPTAELESPEASSARAKSALDALPRIGCERLVRALERIDVGEPAA